MSTNTRKAVWDSLLTADLNRRYWDEISRRYSTWDKYGRLFLSVTTSSTVASWTLWEQAAVVWQALSVASALLAIGLPIFDWSGVAKRTTELSGSWQNLQGRYHTLWLRLEQNPSLPDVLEEFSKLSAQESEMNEGNSDLPVDGKLAEKIQQRVVAFWCPR